MRGRKPVSHSEFFVGPADRRGSRAHAKHSDIGTNLTAFGLCVSCLPSSGDAHETPDLNPEREAGFPLTWGAVAKNREIVVVFWFRNHPH